MQLTATRRWPWFLLAVSLGLQPILGSDPPRLVSHAPLRNAAGAAGSFLPAFSADGRKVVFVSHARNLAFNDNLAPYLNIYVRDLPAGWTHLVSVNTNGIGGGNDDANVPGISSDGRYVAFASAANNLVVDDTNNAADVFVHDLLTGSTRLVSMDRFGGTPRSTAAYAARKSLSLSGNPRLSYDGRRVLFESFASTLTTNCCVTCPATNNLYLRDLDANQTLLVSVNLDGTDGGNGDSHSASLTPDGRFVVYVSKAGNLFPNTTNRAEEVYVRDLAANVTHWASAQVSAFFPPRPDAYHCSNPVISADGRQVAFLATGNDPGAATLLFTYELPSGTSVLVSSNATADAQPHLTLDGRVLAYGDGTNVYVWDRQTSTHELVNVSQDGGSPASAPARLGCMTPDATKVVFFSAGTNLAPNAGNGVSQIFVRDMVARVTYLVTQTYDEAPSHTDTETGQPVISTDGRMVAFESAADDLVLDDLNWATDVFVRDLSIAATTMVSKRHRYRPPATGHGVSLAAQCAVSTDGRFVAFSSLDNTAVPGDTNGQRDIFVRDLAAGHVIPVSTNGSGGFSGDLAATAPLLSANGESVVFAWRTNHSPSASPATLFWRHLNTGALAPVAVRLDGSIDTAAGAPAISPDGRITAFHTANAAGEFVPGIAEGNYDTDVFLRDLVAGTNMLVSVNRSGTNTGNGRSSNPWFSPDGRWLLFASLATDLLPTNTANNPGEMRLFARDLLSSNGALIPIARMPNRPPSLVDRRSVAFSADSRWVAEDFFSSVVLHDVLAQTNRIACSNCVRPSLSADGRLIAYMMTTAWGDQAVNLAVKDLQTGFTKVIPDTSFLTNWSRGSFQWCAPSLSADGRFVVFTRLALVPVDRSTNESGAVVGWMKRRSDVCVYDRLLDDNFFIGGAGTGKTLADDISSAPALAADGRTVVFQSFAADLADGDYNDTRDVFVIHLGGSDTDGDGVDDDWEMAFFSTLARDGGGDLDLDGQSDREEYLSGTDPTNSGSILRVISVTSPGTSSTRVLWQSVPGRTYRVQCKDLITSSDWIDLAPPVTATTTTGAFVDVSALPQAQRFYRVLVND